MIPSAPDRPHRVNDVPGLEPVGFGDFCVTGLAASELPAFLKQLRSGGSMNRAIDPAPAEQRRIRRIDDRIDT